MTTESDRETRTIATGQGATFQIRLWEDRTRGEQWIPSYDAEAVALVDEDFLRTVSNNAVDSGKHSFEFRALVPGTHRLVFEKRMGWKFTAEDRRVFVVHVSGDGARRNPDA